MTYIERLKKIKSLEDLFLLREEIRKELDELNDCDPESLEERQNARFYINRIEARILQLEVKGEALDQIEVT